MNWISGEKGLMGEYQSTPFLTATDTSGLTGASTGGSQEERAPEDIIDALSSILVSFERLIANRSGEELRQAAQDGGWGVVEVLSHLQDWEEITHERVWRMLEEEQPEFEDYDDTLWAIEHEYGSQDGHQVLAHITQLRNELVERLRGLDEAEWQRSAILRGHGEITLMWLISNHTRHDARQAERVREALG